MARPDDYRDMRCTDCRTTISAALDGEDRITPDVEAHLDACAGCRRFETEATSLHRLTRVAPAEPVPDLTASILAAIGEDTLQARERKRDRITVSPEHVSALRVGLFVVAAIQLFTAIPALLGSDAGVPVHVARHIGSFELALAVGFFTAAWFPRRAAGMLPIIGALVACLFVSSIIDVVSGASSFGGESQHLVDLVGLSLVFLMTRTVDARRVAV